MKLANATENEPALIWLQAKKLKWKRDQTERHYLRKETHSELSCLPKCQTLEKAPRNKKAKTTHWRMSSKNGKGNDLEDPVKPLQIDRHMYLCSHHILYFPFTTYLFILGRMQTPHKKRPSRKKRRILCNNRNGHTDI